MPRRFSGKTILITGGASGMGAAVTRRLVAEGGRVIIADLNARKADLLVRELERERPDCVSYQAVDLMDFGSIRAMTDAVRAQTGALHGVLNAAGIAAGGKNLDDPRPDEWRRALAVNLEAPAYVTGLLLPLLRGNQASVVNIASDGALRARGDCPIYDAAKAGLVSLSKSMAAGLAGEGIRVNVVAPGWTVTEFHYARAPDPQAKKAELENGETDYCLLRRRARPEEIAAAILFLLSGESSYVTGAILPVDGGRIGF